MPRFSKYSLDQLATCDPRLQDVARVAIQIADFRVLEGHRGRAAQDEAFRKGLSKVRWPNGKHNRTPSLAMDFAPYYATPPHIRWNDLERFYYVAGIIVGVGHAMGVPLRSGGDWDRDSEVADERFHDLGHIELVSP